MTLLKTIHVTCAYATGLGFLVRGLLAVAQSTLLRHRVVKTLPHIIDTVLLASALAMLYSWSLSPLAQPWLTTKIIALLFYIAFGFAILRWGATAQRRWIGLVGGLLTYGYIVAVAHSKSPWPWQALGVS